MPCGMSLPDKMIFRGTSRQHAFTPPYLQLPTVTVSSLNTYIPNSHVSVEYLHTAYYVKQTLENYAGAVPELPVEVRAHGYRRF